MTGQALVEKLRESLTDPLPLPGAGQTAARHARLMDIGREDLSLARLAEAHWDAVAILAEAGRSPESGAIYGVWAAEKPNAALRLDAAGTALSISGTKMFCSGAGLLDRVLLTVGAPESLLVDVDLRANRHTVAFDTGDWKTTAFAETKTAATHFQQAEVLESDILRDAGWYVKRPGFWHGACGPASCWAGGAAGLLDYALKQKREDPHTLAHLGAMQAEVWALRSVLDTAGREIDAAPLNVLQARVRARTVRHLVEQSCTEILRRLPRAYGPYPLAMDEETGRRYQELDLYVRQSHAERDLEQLGIDVRAVHRG